MEEGNLEHRIISAVAGGAGGIGQAIVRKLVERGDYVIVVDKQKDSGLFNNYPNVTYFQADCTNEIEMRLLSELIRANFPYVNHLAITAGGVYEKGEGNRFEKIPVEDFIGSVTTNLAGPFSAIQCFLPLMKRKAIRDHHKSIVLPGSSNMEGGFGLVPYSSAKAGLVGLAKSAAEELGYYGITINVVEIGGTRTPALPEKLYESIERRSILKRMNAPEDVAGCYLFYTDPASRNVTADVIKANFGQTTARR